MSGGRRNYLVVFDAVPGGTGYLSELWHGDNFVAILEMALAAMLGCECRNDERKDGCYRCVYAYQSQRSLAVISRRAAIDSIQAILEHRGELKSVPTLSEVSLDRRLESELEEKFLAALEAHAGSTPGATRSESVEGGEIRWLLNVDDRAWEIRAQVELGQKQGVGISSRPDFMIESVGRPTGVRPIAVFCDGLAYHVAPEKDETPLADDVAKRRAIMDSGNYDVWTVTWKDVVDFEGGKRAVKAPSVFASLDGHKLGALARSIKLGIDRGFGRKGSMHLLWEYLSRPSAEWSRLADVLTVAWLGAQAPISAEDGDRLEDRLQQADRRFDAGPVRVDADSHALTRFASDDWLGMIVRGAASDITPERLDQVRLTLRLFDEAEGRRDRDFESSWRSFWQAWNLLQFRERVEFLTTSALGEEQPRLSAASSGAAEAAESASSAEVSDPALTELLEYATSACVPIIEAVGMAGLPLPSLDEVVTDGSGEDWDAELAWPDRKLAILSESQVEGRAHFESQGWTVITHPIVVGDVIRRLKSDAGEGGS